MNKFEVVQEIVREFSKLGRIKVLKFKSPDLRFASEIVSGPTRKAKSVQSFLEQLDFTTSYSPVYSTVNSVRQETDGTKIFASYNSVNGIFQLTVQK